MNKIYTLLTLAFLMSVSAFSQQTRTNPALFKQGLTKTELPKTGTEAINFSKVSYLKQAASTPSYGVEVGYTWYDLQTNSGVSRRINKDAAGNIQVVWTKGLDTIIDPRPAQAQRGIGYNYYDASTQTWNPGDSLDTPFGIADVRMGWPSIAPLTGSVEKIFGHPTRLFTNPVKGQTNYSATDLSVSLHGVTNEPFQWYNVAAEGNSIYTLGQVTAASCEFGRSDDGGQTWAISGFFPDSAAGTPLKGTGADGYDIDTRGDTVVVVTGGYTGYQGTEPNDLLMLMSTDRGVTWTSRTIHVFDTINAVFDSTSGGYIVLTPHPDARVTIGSDGVVHVTGSMMAAGTNAGTLTSNTWFPLTRGIWYWNSNMPDGFDLNDSVDYETLILTDSIPDMMTMGSYPGAIADQPSYVAGSFTHPAVCEDVNTGDLYIVFDGICAGSDNNPFDNLWRRDLYVMKATTGSGGMSWCDPINLATLLGASDITDGTIGEEAFPSMEKRSNDNKLHILFQYDTWGGTSLVDQLILEENSIVYLDVDMSLLQCISSLENENIENAISIYPNPATNMTNIGFEAFSKGESTIQITNLMGQTVLTKSIQITTGRNEVVLDLSAVNSGIYLVNISNGKNKFTKKLIIE